MQPDSACVEFVNVLRKNLNSVEDYTTTTAAFTGRAGVDCLVTAQRDETDGKVTRKGVKDGGVDTQQHHPSFISANTRARTHTHTHTHTPAGLNSVCVI